MTPARYTCAAPKRRRTSARWSGPPAQLANARRNAAGGAILSARRAQGERPAQPRAAATSALAAGGGCGGRAAAAGGGGRRRAAGGGPNLVREGSPTAAPQIEPAQRARSGLVPAVGCWDQVFTRGATRMSLIPCGCANQSRCWSRPCAVVPAGSGVGDSLSPRQICNEIPDSASPIQVRPGLDPSPNA